MILYILYASIAVMFLEIAFKALYNVTFHSLARYPGPVSWSAFQLPFIYYLNLGTLHCRVKKLHEEYGDIVRVGPKELSFNDPAAWHDIHGSRPGHSTFERPVEWRGEFPMSKVENLITANDEDHERIRRFIKPAFLESSLRESEPVVHRYVDRLINSLRGFIEEDSKIVEADLASWYNFTAFDTISSLVFGEPFDGLKTRKIHPRLGFGYQFRISLFEVSLKFYPRIRWLVKAIVPATFFLPLMEFFVTTHEMLKRRLNRPGGPDDFLTHILRHDEKHAGSSLNDAELHLNMSLLAVAGVETSAATLCAATNYLLRDLASYKRLTEEIRFNIRDRKELTAEKLSKLPYLTAVLLEALRLCPPSADSARRIVPSGGDTVCGEIIPEGTIVSIMPYATFRSPKNFTFPEEWHPERWLGDEQFKTDNKMALRPFLLGKRACIGQQFAWIELRITLARLLWEFDINVGEKGLPVWDRQKVYTSWVKEPMYVHVSLAQRDDE